MSVLATGRAPGRRLTVIQGERRVSDDPDTHLTTILGSCVAACLRDPVAGVGGMNHFLLPGEDRADDNGARFGAYAMELLINDLLAMGAQRHRLEGKLFGGGRMQLALADIGSTNAEFAERYLAREGIPLMGGSLRGTGARRVEFWPVSGRARQTFVDADRTLFEAEARRPAAPAAPVGDLELF